jgi:hypothetical protein
MGIRGATALAACLGVLTLVPASATAGGSTTLLTCKGDACTALGKVDLGVPQIDTATASLCPVNQVVPLGSVGSVSICDGYWSSRGRYFEHLGVRVAGNEIKLESTSSESVGPYVTAVGASVNGDRVVVSSTCDRPGDEPTPGTCAGPTP